MIDADELLGGLITRGVVDVVGVPCSYLTPMINRVASGSAAGYLPVTHEGEAVAIAAGCWLAGATACVIGQNSGLGNMVNPLTSLTHPSRIPVPLLVSWRGEPGFPDEPQHELMGEITPALLELMRVGHAILPAEAAELDKCLEAGWTEMDREQTPFAFILRNGVMAAQRLDEPPLADPVTATFIRSRRSRDAPTRMAALECLIGTLTDEAAVVSTTGKTSRELYTLADRPQHFYLVGAMGSASAVGLGVARHTSRPVVVIDGDGAALMRLGTLAAVGAHGGPNLTHVLLDNRVHDSTGGQRSLASQVDFPAVARACGYARVYDCADLDEFAEAVGAAQAEPGPAFVYLTIRPGSLAELGRPAVRPPEVARRFRDFVTGRGKDVDHVS
ncbi:phosphonopyruvate decarboxylase [Nocardia pseudobrasiliensis]|uniref:Phosphonopyruvate decarboxylase n=1 Tax=Nocardia pseudobrasiliensis TaxID=45979 RepID=A0A370I4M4_9NOCA|nr:phosphonopyruvate decarboxylase [Nocardia pseudobrasiliensis]RDI65540.1 phosphonopyruvate decarboxylase [Nocardia pseudobrasiliensis]